MATVYVSLWAGYSVYSEKMSTVSLFFAIVLVLKTPCTALDDQLPSEIPILIVYLVSNHVFSVNQTT